MASTMSLKELKVYFEEKVDPEFYFFNPMHGWTVKSDYFEPHTFTLYQCVDKIWERLNQESIVRIFEICVTSGDLIFQDESSEYSFSYVGKLGPHNRYLYSSENLKVECIYLINELAKLEEQDCLEHAKAHLRDLIDIWQK
jgi:hypothetical protein